MKKISKVKAISIETNVKHRKKYFHEQSISELWNNFKQTNMSEIVQSEVKKGERRIQNDLINYRPFF